MLSVPPPLHPALSCPGIYGGELHVLAVALCCERKRQARAKLNSCSILSSVSVLVDGARVPGKLSKVGNLDRERSGVQ